MSGLPESYLTPMHLPFNRTCLEERFRMMAPDEDPGGTGVWVALRGRELLVDDADGFRLPYGEIDRFGWGDGLFIGMHDDRPCRLVHLFKTADIPVGLKAYPLMDPEPVLPIDLLTLGGLGRMIRHWEKESLHCGTCGRLMERLPGEWGKVCTSCRTHHFPRVHPCAIVLVQRPGEVLLTRKPEWAPNRYSLVAGFLEMGECLE